ncbi:MAG: hypothetical protein M3295_06105 [Chloroflexota bacterium]|nr:hypothetical protein [Chloroflexota bacterium]
MPRDRLLSMRDIADGLLETSDGHHIGRVADIRAQLADDGSLVLTHLLLGPQATAGRVAGWLRRVADRVLGRRFVHRIPIDEVVEYGPTIRLRGKAADYSAGHADEWFAEHIVRFIPGSGR